MRGKRIIRIISIAVIAIIVITGVIILGLYIDYERKQRIEYDMDGNRIIIKYDENGNRVEYYENGNRRYNYENERTNEEYMAILTDNQDDFEYVAQTMQQWSSGYIDFYDDYGRRIDFENVSSNNPEIEDEISNNADFYKSLKNLYELDEIDYIMIGKEDIIMFYFSKFPQHYHGGVIYGENIEMNSFTYTIDDKWVLQMLPNT